MAIGKGKSAGAVVIGGGEIASPTIATEADYL
jgi:hypothetical protein